MAMNDKQKRDFDRAVKLHKYMVEHPKKGTPGAKMVAKLLRCSVWKAGETVRSLKAMGLINGSTLLSSEVPTDTDFLSKQWVSTKGRGNKKKSGASPVLNKPLELIEQPFDSPEVFTNNDQVTVEITGSPRAVAEMIKSFGR